MDSAKLSVKNYVTRFLLIEILYTLSSQINRGEAGHFSNIKIAGEGGDWGAVVGEGGLEFHNIQLKTAL